ncbi:DUF3137 domain-containing protein [Candidatus Peregrinibacteria bacterium]|nr:DUF3137 domain-containing protein [Candidatus Peregrinibacteria bacterium]
MKTQSNQPDFSKFLEYIKKSGLYRKLEVYEKKRKNILLTKRRIRRIAILILVLLILLTIFIDQDINDRLNSRSVFFWLAFFDLIVIMTTFVKPYVPQFFIQMWINIYSFLTKSDWKKGKKLDLESVKKFQQFSKADRVASSESLNTKLYEKNINICYLDVSIKNEISKKNERITMFLGTAISFDLEKKVDCDFVIRTSFIQAIDFMFEIKPSGMDRVKVEDPRFEKIFQVYATDQIEIRRILTPSLMEDLSSAIEFLDKSSIVIIGSESKILIITNFFPFKKEFEFETYLDQTLMINMLNHGNKFVNALKLFVRNFN